MSNHKINVIKIEEIMPHAGADRLVLIKVWDYICVVGKDQFKVGDLAAFIIPDSVVDVTRPEFAFLAKPDKPEKTKYRITVSRLRGVYSSGLLIPAPIGSKEGDDVADNLGITHWEPGETKLLRGGAGNLGAAVSEKGPKLDCPHYDLENIKRYSKVIQPGEEVLVTGKIHGCFQRTAKIKTTNGFKKIKDIKVNDIVLGFDHKQNKIVETKVLNTFKNGKTKEWIKLNCERIRDSNNPSSGYGFITFKLTPNHKVWSNTKNDYIEISKCKVGEVLLQSALETSLTDIQKQILIGKMIGDGSYTSHSKVSGRISFSHVNKDEQYFEYCKKILAPIMGATDYNKSGYGSNMIRTHTKCMREIHGEFKKWFTDGKKEIPEDLPDYITPISLAFWYMDDGCLCHTPYQKDRAQFATCAFSKKSCQTLQKCLKKFGIDSVLFSSKNKNNSNLHNRIRLNTKDAYKFFNLIGKYIHPSMRRKIPVEFRKQSFKEIIDKKTNKVNLITFPVIIQKIDNIIEGCNRDKFDIETETHNFFAHNILVHNSQSKFVYHNNRMFCGSKNQWKRAPGCYLVQSKTLLTKVLQSILIFLFASNLEKMHNFFENNRWIRKYKYKFVQSVGPNAWWEALKQNPWLENWCKNNPNVTVYGEVFGSSVQGQDFHYGYKENQIGMSVFDIHENGKWISNKEFYTNERFKELKFVDLLYQGPFDLSIISEIAERKENFNNAGHIREGVVIKLASERNDPAVGRVVLKLISNQYLLKGKE